MTEFIKQQQELACNKVLNLWPNDDEITQTVMREIDTLITQIITNTGEELLRRVEGERQPFKVSENMELREVHNATLDTIKQHITKLTGVE